MERASHSGAAASSANRASAFSQGLYIDGARRAATGGAIIPVLDPSTESTLAHVPDADPGDAAAAVDAAARAAPDWAATPPRKRSEILRRCFELMTARSEELAHLISLENGKALGDARGEVAYAAEFFRWNAEEAVRITGEFGLAPSGANRIIVDYQPVGVCVLITPWNFPAAMATRKIAPALAAGCTVICKPATETPLTAFAVAQILHDAGVPAGVVNVLTTSKAGALSKKILNDPRVRKVSFTGSTEVGRVLLKEASEQVINCSMELGGNAPFIVFDDADLDAAVEGAMIAKMRNGGEACTAANRFYVQSGVAEEFGRRLAERMKALRMGPGLDDGVQVGPLVNTDTVDKVDELVRGAVDAGAEAVVGGRRPEDSAFADGFYYEPTVLLGVRPGSPILDEEIFGPAAPIVTFDDEDEAVRLANATEYGLVSYVYTGDLA